MHKVIADVRGTASIRSFGRHKFDLMLDPHDSVAAQHREAARILRQIGYECAAIVRVEGSAA